MSLGNGVVSTALLLFFLLPRSAASKDDARPQAEEAAEYPPPVFNLGEELNPKMAIIMVVLVSAFFSLGFFSVYIRQCAQRRIQGGGALLFGGGGRSWRLAYGVGDDVIRSFPSFCYSAAKRLMIGKGSLECAVCLNEYEDDDALRMLPKCGHVFHSDCIDAWLSTHTTCPVCRDNLVPKPGEDLSFTTVQIFDPHNSNSEPEANGNRQSNESAEVNPTSQSSSDMTHSTEMQIRGLYLRSHSLVQVGERFTLLNSTLKRTRSLGALDFQYDRNVRSDLWGFSSA